MVRWRAWRDRFVAGEPTDAGIGLVLVIGYAVVIGIVLTVSVASVTSVLGSGRSHVQFGQAVDSAEAGVDQTLARLSLNANFATAGAIIPPAWQDGFPDAATERRWALSAVETAIGTTPALLQRNVQGEFAAIRPGNAQTVYSVGWEPSRSNAQRVRVLRNDYIFSGYSPTNAITTKGNVTIDGSFTLSSNAGTALTPDVHSEGQITACAGSTTKPTGTVIGSVGGGGCGTIVNSETIPKVNPRDLYNSLAMTYASQWYDLCNDGTVRSPASAPCTGPTTGSTRGWTYYPGERTWRSSAPQTGIYYVYRGNADIISPEGSYLPTHTVSIITEATNNLGCYKSDGNVTFIRNKIIPALPFISIYSGGSVALNAQHTVGEVGHPGLVAAQENLSFTTSSAPGVVGAAVANNFCGGSNLFQGAEIRFDGNMTIRTADLIRSTLQTELN